jgi:hypothetical protein
MRRRSILFVAVILVLGLTAFAYWPVPRARAADGSAKASLQPGITCKVYFRGDAAGQSVQSYVPTISNNASLSGRLTSLDDQWVVLAGDQKEYHVPRSAVLMIEVAKP